MHIMTDNIWTSGAYKSYKVLFNHLIPPIKISKTGILSKETMECAELTTIDIFGFSFIFDKEDKFYFVD